MADYTIGPSLLWRLGYRHLTRQQVADACIEIYEALEFAVGQRISRQLSSTQLDEFEKLLNGPERRALAWLEATVPAYKSIVETEFQLLQRRLGDALRVASAERKESGSMDEAARQ